VGDDMAFPIGGGRDVRLRVVGVVERSIPGRSGESILVGWPDASDGFAVAGADAFAIRFEPTASAQDRAALVALATGYALETNPIDRVAGAIDATLARVFGLFDALALIAVFVAGLGSSTPDDECLRARGEIGILRAAGMTRPQVWRMVVVEVGCWAVGAIRLRDRGVLAGGALARRPATTCACRRAGLARDRHRRRVRDRGRDVAAGGRPGWLLGSDRPRRPVRVGGGPSDQAVLRVLQKYSTKSRQRPRRPGRPGRCCSRSGPAGDPSWRSGSRNERSRASR
jgi:hypothetical protein